MPMIPSFFSRQESARRSTLLLVLYFLLTVVLIILAMDVVFFLMARLFQVDHDGSWWWHAWTPQALIGTLFLVVGGSLLEFVLLYSGGRAVAEMVGASRVDFGTREPALRQLINVAEEMAIAAGVPVPALYVMPREPGINAFVAGYSPQEAVLVVTAGSLEHLNREELQGVVGHEFSHILNGDMRLNSRLISVLAGVLMLGRIGGFIMRAAQETSLDQNGRRRIGFFLLYLVGLLIWSVGAIGLLFTRLIKAAISRQREWLADASSVQFTRNPWGLASALDKIREQSEGSFLRSPYAETMSHMCIGEVLPLGRWFATHPPLDERIHMLAPDFYARTSSRQQQVRITPVTPKGIASSGAIAELVPIPYAPGAALPQELVARVGTVEPQDLEAAHELRAKLPQGVARALETTSGARALVYAMLAERSRLPVTPVREFLERNESAELAEQVLQLRQVLAGQESLVALPLLELAAPRLSLLDMQAARRLIAQLQAFCYLDHRLSVFEFALLILLKEQLLPRRPLFSRLPLSTMGSSLAMVAAVFLQYGSLSDAARQRVYDESLTALLAVVPPCPTGPALSLPQLAKALQELARLSPQEKHKVITLCAHIVQADGRLAPAEYELLRVVSSVLGCPMPLTVKAVAKGA